MSISAPSEPEALTFTSEDDLPRAAPTGGRWSDLEGRLAQRDFLPSVWEKLPTRSEFWRASSAKRRLSPEHWSSRRRRARHTQSPSSGLVVLTTPGRLGRNGDAVAAARLRVLEAETTRLGVEHRRGSACRSPPYGRVASHVRPIIDQLDRCSAAHKRVADLGTSGSGGCRVGSRGGARKRGGAVGAASAASVSEQLWRVVTGGARTTKRRAAPRAVQTSCTRFGSRPKSSERRTAGCGVRPRARPSRASRALPNPHRLPENRRQERASVADCLRALAPAQTQPRPNTSPSPAGPGWSSRPQPP